MGCNCKNARKLEKLEEQFPELIDNKTYKGLILVLNYIIFYVKMFLIVLAIIFLMPIMTIKVLYGFVTTGGVTMKIPKLLRD